MNGAKCQVKKMKKKRATDTILTWSEGEICRTVGSLSVSIEQQEPMPAQVLHSNVVQLRENIGKTGKDD